MPVGFLLMVRPPPTTNIKIERFSKLTTPFTLSHFLSSSSTHQSCVSSHFGTALSAAFHTNTHRERREGLMPFSPLTEVEVRDKSGLMLLQLSSDVDDDYGDDDTCRLQKKIIRICVSVT